VSVECIVWALNHAPVPRDRRDAPSLVLTLVGLANHANADGTDAFPSVARLVRYTRLSESTVRRALDALEELGLISPSDPAVIAAKIKRADRRPQGWNLAIHRSYPQAETEVSPRQVVEQHGVSAAGARGVISAGTRCHGDTRNVLNHPPESRPSRERAPEGARADGTPCGQCDARVGDPIALRQTTDAAGRSVKCPNCHPHAGAVTR
jgi:Helix-turn-helix domain